MDSTKNLLIKVGRSSLKKKKKGKKGKKGRRAQEERKGQEIKGDCFKENACLLTKIFISLLSLKHCNFKGVLQIGIILPTVTAVVIWQVIFLKNINRIWIKFN